ncbi:MAG: hypothetical protein GY937_10110 [bacterium]|nr:hypothetical protein [bacterium]
MAARRASPLRGFEAAHGSGFRLGVAEAPAAFGLNGGCYLRGSAWLGCLRGLLRSPTSGLQFLIVTLPSRTFPFEYSLKWQVLVAGS